jgi:hypothetical protein
MYRILSHFPFHAQEFERHFLFEVFVRHFALNSSHVSFNTVDETRMRQAITIVRIMDLSQDKMFSIDRMYQVLLTLDFLSIFFPSRKTSLYRTSHVICFCSHNFILASPLSLLRFNPLFGQCFSQSLVK